MSSRVLLVEDDVALGAQIVDRLRGAGCEPTWRKEGQRLHAGDLPEVELVVLDLMLPGAYGLDMLRDLRRHHETPVLVLSARNDPSDKIRALQLGADDYMTKPFWPEELIERVRARLRRPVLARDDILEVGDLRIAPLSREVLVAGRRIDLTRSEFEILFRLAARPGAAITRAALLQRIVGAERETDERGLDAHVSRLRKKLGDASYIQTVWGIGYRLGTLATRAPGRSR